MAKDATEADIGKTAAWDDDGAGAAETTVVPASTEMATQLAWSRDDADADDERAHRSWRVALVSAVAVLVVSGCIALVIAVWPRGHGDGALQGGVVEPSAPSAAALPLPPPPPLPTSVASTPPARGPRPLEYDARGVAILPKDPTLEERREVLVAKFERAGIPYSSPLAASIDAESVCEYLKSGHYTARDLFGWVSRTHPSFDPDQVGEFTGASVGTYCRQYGYLYANGDNGSTS